jgi:hypothetical protein
MAGWVTDNCRALCLLLPWAYQCLAQDLFTYRPYVQPATPLTAWLLVECAAYLKSRGEPIRGRPVAELRAVIQEWMTRPAGPPPVLVPPACNVDGPVMLQMLWHCYHMFKSLFADTVDRSTARRCVQRFLSSVTLVDEELRPDGGAPKYVTTYNLASLLRAVDQAAARRSMRYYQEGGQDGEGIVKPLRDLLPPNLPSKFACNLLSNRFRQSVLNKWVEEFGGTVVWHEDVADDQVDDEPQLLEAPVTYTAPAIAHDFRRYPLAAVITDFLEAGVPVSLVYMTSEHGVTSFGCVVQRRKQWTLLPLQARYHHHNPHQLPQFTLAFRPGQELIIREASGDMAHVIVACGYALPVLLPVAQPTVAQTYGILTDDMLHLHIDGALK